MRFGSGLIPMLLMVATLAPGGTCRAQADIEQLQPDAGPERDQPPDQVTPDDVGDRTRIESIGPEAPRDPTVEQPLGGRDLCHPSVPESVRQEAGVECERDLSPEQRPARRPLSESPLATPEGDNLEEEFKGLGLDEDVPSTILLQQ